MRKVRVYCAHVHVGEGDVQAARRIPCHAIIFFLNLKSSPYQLKFYYSISNSMPGTRAVLALGCSCFNKWSDKTKAKSSERALSKFELASRISKKKKQLRVASVFNQGSFPSVSQWLRPLQSSVDRATSRITGGPEFEFRRWRSGIGVGCYLTSPILYSVYWLTEHF